MMSGTTLVKQATAATGALAMLVMGYMLFAGGDATAQQPTERSVVETELATEPQSQEFIGMLLVDIGDEEGRSETEQDASKRPEKASESTIADDHVIFPVQTKLQRKWLGECSTYALLNGVAAFEAGRVSSELLERFKGDLQGYASDEGAVLIRTYYWRGSALYADDLAVRTLHESVNDIAREAGFSTVRVQSYISNDESATWQTAITPLKPRDSKNGEASEAPIAVGEIRIYPVRTHLSRCLTSADVVVDFPSIPDQGQVDTALQGRIRSAVDKLQLESKTQFRVQLPELDPASGVSRDEVLQEMVQLANDLGFDKTTVQLGPSAWSGL